MFGAQDTSNTGREWLGSSAAMHHCREASLNLQTVTLPEEPPTTSIGGSKMPVHHERDVTPSSDSVSASKHWHMGQWFKFMTSMAS